MTYIPNGLPKRLDWVIRTYAQRPVIPYLTIRAAAYAVGDDHLANDLFPKPQIRMGGGWVVKVGAEATLPVTRKLAAEAKNALVIKAGPHTAFDPIIPWAASVLAKEVRRVERATKRYRDDLGGHTSPAYKDYIDAERALDRAWLVLKHRGAAIAMWFADERPKLAGMTVREVNEAVIEWGRRQALTRPVPQGEVVFEWPDGWTVQRLGPDALEAEGEIMQHCVGGYCELVGGGSVTIFSLRDAHGHPHVTMEYRNASERFEQISGKQNQTPLPRYRARVLEWLRADFPRDGAAQLMAGARDFDGVDLTGVTFDATQPVSEATFRKADLRGVHFLEALVVGCDFTDADMGTLDTYLSERSRFEDCNFTRVNLQKAHIEATFHGCDFTEADLRGALVRGVFLGGRNVFTNVLVEGSRWEEVYPDTVYAEVEKQRAG